MASYRPSKKASNGRTHGSKLRPWVARRRRQYVEFWLGAFETRGEAEEAEREFDKAYPGARQGRPR